MTQKKSLAMMYQPLGVGYASSKAILKKLSENSFLEFSGGDSGKAHYQQLHANETEYR